ncbi:HTTM domain-containing protein [Streptomyces hebeiensis]|uniref:HTTM domain-containing protein n=1 Tax=Streptomyces hebeiensis TaxID=229486 RepID=A0ABN1UJX4_9ACTN
MSEHATPGPGPVPTPRLSDANPPGSGSPDSHPSATRPSDTHASAPRSPAPLSPATGPSTPFPSASSPSVPPPSLTSLGAAGRRRVAHAVQRVTATALGPYQSAVLRIGFAGTWLLFLLREVPHRRELYGPDGPWSWDMARQLIARNHAFTALMWSDSAVWFEAVFAVAVLSSALLMLGWRTRTMSVIFMLGVLSLQNRSIFVGDGGDNVVHLMAIYLVLTRCGRVWSLDARRAATAARAAATAPVRDRVGPVLWGVMAVPLLVGTVTDGVTVEVWLLVLCWGMWATQGLWWLANRRGPTGEARALLDVFANILHNGALLVIMAEVCLIYATAGWYKIQGSRWQDGTALYYPLKLDYFSPWPGLSDLLAANGIVVLLLTYGTVAVQVAFPFALLNRRVKNVLLVVMMLEHLGIAVLLGLPFFSLAMITADAVFLPTGFLLWLGGRVATRPRRPVPKSGGAPAPRVPVPSSGEQ